MLLNRPVPIPSFSTVFMITMPCLPCQSANILTHLWNKTEQCFPFVVVEQVSKELVLQLVLAGAVVGKCVQQSVLAILLAELVNLLLLPLETVQLDKPFLTIAK